MTKTTENTNRVNVAEFRKEFAGVTKAIDQASGKIASSAAALFRALKTDEVDFHELKAWATNDDKKRAQSIMHEFLAEHSPEYRDTVADIDKAREEKASEVKSVLDAKLRAIRNHAATVILIALDAFFKAGDVEAPTKGANKGRLLVGTPSDDDSGKVIYSVTPVNTALAAARKTFRGTKPANERSGQSLVEKQKSLVDALKVIRELVPGLNYGDFTSANRQIIVEAYAALEEVIDNDDAALADLKKLNGTENK